MNDISLQEPAPPHRLILYSGSLLVRLTVAVALWQVLNPSNRLQRAVATGVLNLISALAGLLGYFVQRAQRQTTKATTTFVFTDVTDFFGNDAADVLQQHQT